MDKEYIEKDKDLNEDESLIEFKVNKKRKYRLLSTMVIGFMMLVVSVLLFWKPPAFVMNVFDRSENSKFNHLIEYDKGLQAAVEHDFIQVINKSDEHEGINITVHSVIVDEVRMVVLFSMEGVENYKEVRVRSVKLLETNGDTYPAVISFGNLLNNEKSSNLLYDRVGFDFVENKIPEDFKLILTLEAMEKSGDTEDLTSTWSIPIQVDKKMFKNKNKVYSINETIEIEKQALTFHSITIYPTRTKLKVTYDENNTKKIFGFDDLRITDNEGHVWGSSGGFRQNISDKEEIIYLESSYFDDPKELYIEFSGLSALEKNDLEFQVDLSKNNLESISNEYITLSSITEFDDYMELRVMAKRATRLGGIYHTNIGFEFMDASGEKYRMKSVGHSEIDEYIEELFLKVPKNEYIYPLTFTITGYPSTIKENVRIRIK